MKMGGFLYSIREAVIDDIPALMEELKAFSDFYKTKMPMFRDEGHSSKVLTTIIENHLFYVAVKDVGERHDLVGFIAGYFMPHIYNPDIATLTECFWWTRPEHRRSGIGLELLEMYIQFGKKNANWILMTLEDDTPVDPALLISRGFRLKETNYIMETV